VAIKSDAGVQGLPCEGMCRQGKPCTPSIIQIPPDSYNIFANIVRDHLFWHRTADLKAKLVLGAPNGNAKHQLGKWIGGGFVRKHQF